VRAPAPARTRASRSALGRLSLAYAASFLVISGLFFAGAMHLVAEKNRERLQSLVLADGRDLAAKLEDAPPPVRTEVARAIVGARVAGGKDRVLYALVVEGQPWFGNLAPTEIFSHDGEARLKRTGWLSASAVDRVEAAPGAHVLIARRQDDAGLERDVVGVGLLALLLAALVAFVIAPLAGRRLVRRVEAINAACIAFGDGDLAVRAPGAEDRDEFGALARSVNGMFERIDNLVGGLRDVSNRAAHDLRTPIARLRSQQQRGRDATSLAEAQAAAEAAIEETDRILATFDALLDIAEIETGSTLALADVDLRAVVTEAVDLYRPVAEEAGMILSVAADPASVRGDHSLLVRLVANLLDNAIKYGPSGSTIEIRIARSGAAQVLTILDQGPGIPLRDRASVLKRSVRGADQARKGLGLGLALVAAVAHRHGAALDLESGRGRRGLAVRLTFPNPA
jgi:signal transduction histidine kinase